MVNNRIMIENDLADIAENRIFRLCAPGELAACADLPCKFQALGDTRAVVMHPTHWNRMKQIVRFDPVPTQQRIKLYQRFCIIIDALEQRVLIVHSHADLMQLAERCDGFRPEFDGMINVDSELDTQVIERGKKLEQCLAHV